MQPSVFTLTGVVDRITFKSAETGFAVLKMKVGVENCAHAFVDSKGIVTIIGAGIGHFNVGEKIEVQGNPVQHSNYGWRLEVSNATLREPSSTWEIQRYLAKNVKHVDAHFARKIVEAFGDQTMQILDTNPDRLSEVSGFGTKRIEAVKQAWIQKRADRELIVFFTSIGLPSRFVDAIKRKYKDRPETISEIIRGDPYVLARDIDGIGFATADEVAKKIGIPEMSPFRIKAAIFHVIRERQLSRGDCFQYAQDLVSETLLFLKHPSITPTMVVEMLQASVASQELVTHDNRVYVRYMDAVESDTVAMLKILMSRPMPAELQGERLERIIQQSMASSRLQLDPSQERAVRSALSTKVSILTGGPGVGKTTVTKSIVNGFQLAGIPIRLLAPTGRAQKRMAELIGKGASTIHRALGYGCKIDEKPEPLSGAIIVDEMSMVDAPLFNKMLSAITPDSILLLVGDQDQLPSVGPGSVLRDLLKCLAIQSTTLTKIHRQAEGSDIIVNAHGINQGYLPRPNHLSRNTFVAQDFYNHNFYTCFREEPTQQADAVVWLASFATQRMGFNPMSDVHIMSPQHNGPNGVQALNARLQLVLNPNPPDSMTRGHESKWCVGDKLMVHKNTYPLDVFNGDIGILREIVRERDVIKAVRVDIDGRDVRVPSELFGILNLAYATTVHKCQGSEYPVAIVVLHTSHYTLLQRNLIYTAVTRGRKWVFLVAHPSAMATALGNQSTSRRNTFMAERFNEETTHAGR